MSIKSPLWATPNRLIVFTLLALFFFSACSKTEILDMNFNLDSYNKIVSTKLFNSDEIDQYDWFLLNYTIKRQKAAYGYAIEGKTYREILEIGRELQETGLPVQTTFNFNGQNDAITQIIKDIESSMTYKKGHSKVYKKTLTFRCRYTNTSDRQIALQTSTFQVFGPFKDHITSLGYEVNCLMKPQESITINYIVDAKEIINNLRWEENYYVKTMGADDFLNSIDIRPSGNTSITKTHGYEKCKHGNTNIAPFKIWDYFKDVDTKKCMRINENGRVVELLLGDAHYIINDAQEIQNMKRIGQGAVK